MEKALAHPSTAGAAQGFTLVELLVTLAVAAILVGFALPAMNNFLDQRTATARINDFVLAVNYARSEAARLGGPVSVQAVNAGDGSNEWGPGFCVTVGNPGNCNAPLRSFPAVDGFTFDGRGRFDGEDTLTFNSRGVLTLGDVGTVELCSTDDDERPGRVVSLTLIGRAAVWDSRDAEGECPT